MNESRTPSDEPILESLARYIAEMRSYISHPTPMSLSRLDDAFAKLRSLCRDRPWLRSLRRQGRCGGL